MKFHEEGGYEEVLNFHPTDEGLVMDEVSDIDLLLKMD